MTMMATLLAKVQLLRDLKELRADAKIEEHRRQESLLQSNSKVGPLVCRSTAALAGCLGWRSRERSECARESMEGQRTHGLARAFLVYVRMVIPPFFFFNGRGVRGGKEHERETHRD